MIVMAIGSTSFAKAQCVTKVSQIDDVPAIKNFVDRIGGTNRVFGTWEFGGVGFGIGRTLLTLANHSDNLMGRVDDSRLVGIQLCASGNNISLKVPGKGTYQVRAAGRGHIQIAGEATGGQFYSFQYRGRSADGGGDTQLADSQSARPTPASATR